MSIRALRNLNYKPLKLNKVLLPSKWVIFFRSKVNKELDIFYKCKT